MKRLTNLDLMKEADTYPYPDKEDEAARYKDLTDTLYNLTWKDGQILGFMLPPTVEALVAVPENIRGPISVDVKSRTVHAFEHLATEPERTAVVANVMAYWRDNKAFEILHGWRDELWPVYISPDEVLYSAERSGIGMLGVMRYGVHMIGYVRDPNAEYGIKIWVPRRAASKPNYPNMLDNTVAGGFMTGEDPFECIIREADEEANLPEQLMRERAEYMGQVTYIYITDERAGGEAGLIYPEMQWIYEIELPADVEPTPKDGEVAEFRLMTIGEVKEELAQGSFKPNCALVTLEFFVRHGIITPDNEPDYHEIVRRIHRKLAFPGPHQVSS